VHFDSFWTAYPKKKNKGHAENTWKKLKTNGELFEKIMDGLSRAIASRDWTKEDGRYIPHPATWLNAKGWEDEYVEVKRKGYLEGWDDDETDV
jgi:hypothetical protein